ncbi:MAG: peptidylprolyl isomerase [Clostridiales Family XIII bacterium]|jgi:parvulin-like peptidyl-prolyl isomerase|nr:peptidylprolyl isomerase [Clostridiales Family XIII bacterium]
MKNRIAKIGKTGAAAAFFALAMSALLSLSGCGGAGGGDKSEVVAKVGDVEIAEDRLNAFTELLFSMYGLDFSGLEESDKNMYKADTLDTMVQIAALEQHFKGKDILKDEDIDGNLDRIKSGIAQTEGLEAGFKEKGITDDTLRYFIESQFYFQAFQEEVANGGGTPPTEAEIEAYYKAHEQEFSGEEERRVSHILVGDDTHADADRQLAEEIREKIASGAETFEDMAKQYGKDGTSALGGDLDYAKREAYVPAFGDVAFTLPQGELSGVVESEFGFHVLKVTDIRNTRSLDAQRESIRYMLTLQALVDEYGAVYPSDKYPAPEDRAALAEENADATTDGGAEGDGGDSDATADDADAGGSGGAQEQE